MRQHHVGVGVAVDPGVDAGDVGVQRHPQRLGVAGGVGGSGKQSAEQQGRKGKVSVHVFPFVFNRLAA
ncbi:hypothetical protein D3C72_2239380 [compost metagenome]